MLQISCKKCANKRMHSDSKKSRSFFALLFPVGEVDCYPLIPGEKYTDEEIEGNKKADAYYKAKLGEDCKEKLEKKQKQELKQSIVLGNNDPETVNVLIPLFRVIIFVCMRQFMNCLYIGRNNRDCFG